MALNMNATGRFTTFLLTAAWAFLAGGMAWPQAPEGKKPLKQDAPKESRQTIAGTLQPNPGTRAKEGDFLLFPAPSDYPLLRPDQATQLTDRELVLGVAAGDQAIAFPIRFLALSMVVHQQQEDTGGWVVTWCPLAGTGRVFSRNVGEQRLSFQFVNGLHQDNLVLADKETGSLWSQLQGAAIEGKLAGQSLEPIASLQTTWKHWLSLHPDTKVMVIKQRRGMPYVYRDYAKYQPGPEHRFRKHDVSKLGLGVIAKGKAYYYPLDQLEAAEAAPSVAQAGHIYRIRHDLAGLTAWLESEGPTLPTVLTYREAWLAFHPKTMVFEAKTD